MSPLHNSLIVVHAGLQAIPTMTAVRSEALTASTVSAKDIAQSATHPAQLLAMLHGNC